VANFTIQQSVQSSRALQRFSEGMTSYSLWLCLTVPLLSISLQLAEGSVLYVDGYGSGTESGDSWGNAIKFLSTALTAASDGDTIEIASVNLWRSSGSWQMFGNKAVTVRSTSGDPLNTKLSCRDSSYGGEYCTPILLDGYLDYAPTITFEGGWTKQYNTRVRQCAAVVHV
jgi:hypothetical protein